MAGTSPQIIGRYAIYGKIASGGMATVHFGRLLGGAGFSRTVAIKRLHPHLAEDTDVLSTLIDEARMAARIHHPNVVPTLDVVSKNGELLLVMEYVRGESLGRLIKTENAAGHPIPLPVASAIVIGCLHGLHAAHEATSDAGTPLGIVHRDVSPQNILVGIDGMARVIDFGVAKAAGRINTTRDGMIKGKIAYMAPEQLLGNTVGRTADVYAMGVVLWEMLTGKRLVMGETDTSVMAVAFQEAKEAPSVYRPDIPPELDRLVLKALAPEPADRFETALTMAELLLPVMPPAFPTDVGAWCLQTAHESIAKRSAALAEIESESSITTAPRPPGTDVGDFGATLISEPMVAPETERQPSQFELPTVTAHSSSTAPIAAPAGYSRGVVIAVTLASGILAGAIALQVWPTAPPRRVEVPAAAASPATATPPPAATPTPTATAVPTPIVVPVPTAVENPAPRPDTPPAVTVSRPPPGPSPAVTHPPPSTPHVLPHPPVVAAPPVPTTAPPKPKCDPPYFIDSAGDRQYKPECL